MRKWVFAITIDVVFLYGALMLLWLSIYSDLIIGKGRTNVFHSILVQVYSGILGLCRQQCYTGYVGSFAVCLHRPLSCGFRYS